MDFMVVSRVSVGMWGYVGCEALKSILRGVRFRDDDWVRLRNLGLIWGRILRNMGKDSECWNLSAPASVKRGWVIGVGGAPPPSILALKNNRPKITL